jgi:hypothetical protein
MMKENILSALLKGQISIFKNLEKEYKIVDNFHNEEFIESNYG